MFWLHASFGVGVTSGTWIMSLVVNSGQSWQLGYAIVGGLQIGLALVFLFTRARWTQPETATVQASDSSSAQDHKPPRSSSLSTGCSGSARSGEPQKLNYSLLFLLGGMSS